MVQNFSRFVFFIAVLIGFGKIAGAEAPQFIFPVACTLGEDCWSVNYVDMDPAEGAVKDFKCGVQSYDGHKGTDFALRSLADVEVGVDVLSAAAGTVLRLRDSEIDSVKSEAEMAAIKEQTKECGNGVFIDHGRGLQTIYCHMKQGSVIVKPGQKIKAGQKIGQVGQSGFAEFPHLHFGIVWEDGVVDPYSGATNNDGCGREKQSLWALGLPMDYTGAEVFDAGFRARRPDFEAIKKGESSPERLNAAMSAFVFWAGFYNVHVGDEIHLRIIDGDGAVFNERREIQEKYQARYYYYTGRRTSDGLPSGTYKGIASIKRADGSEDKIEREIIVE